MKIVEFTIFLGSVDHSLDVLNKLHAFDGTLDSFSTVLGIPIGTNCVPVIADLFCYGQTH